MHIAGRRFLACLLFCGCHRLPAKALLDKDRPPVDLSKTSDFVFERYAKLGYEKS